MTNWNTGVVELSKAMLEGGRSLDDLRKIAEPYLQGIPLWSKSSARKRMFKEAQELSVRAIFENDEILDNSVANKPRRK